MLLSSKSLVAPYKTGSASAQLLSALVLVLVVKSVEAVMYAIASSKID